MNKLLTLGVVVAVLLGGLNFFMPTVVEKQLGAVAGPDVYSYLSVHGPLTQGGGVNATSTTAATYTMVTADIDTFGTLEIKPNVNSTFTLTATSSLAMVPNQGDVRKVWVQNASTTAASTLTFAAGTGIDLQFTEATGGDLVLNGLDWAELTFIRQNDTDITVIFNEFTEAD